MHHTNMAEIGCFVQGEMSGSGHLQNYQWLDLWHDSTSIHYGIYQEVYHMSHHGIMH